jgi:lipid-A-disaccharide synthase
VSGGGDGHGPLVYLMAGEASGDALGARLMAALKAQTGGDIRFAGVGGLRMQAEGLKSLFPMDEIAVMGLAEVLPRIALIRRRIRETAADIQATRPDAIVGIDAPGFTFRVQQSLGPAIPAARIHYVAPSVWAWKPWRAKKAAALLDHLLVLLPFEPPLFERHGLPASFVGHPVIESGADRGDGAGFRVRHGIAADAKLVCLLPGSRAGEVTRMLPVLRGAAGLLGERFPGLAVVLPTMPGVAARVRAAVADWPVAPVVLEGDAEKYDAFAAADAALAASGTVALELAMAGAPSVIGYRMNALTWRLVKAMVRVQYVNIVNLLLEREAVPELLQYACTPARLAEAAARLIEEPKAAEAQRKACRRAIAMLRDPDALPSDRAAEIVLRCITERAEDG